MSIIEEKCKQKGVRLTDQRKVIAKILSESKEVYGSKDHPDVDELHKRVTVIDDKISIATVYRTVKLFEEAGILIKHDIEELQKKIAKKLGYNLVDHKLELYGSKIKK
jgi:Fur family ferric uptake transcriptional regulator